MKKFVFLIVCFLIFILCFYKNSQATITNEEKFFIRVSEKYDTVLKQEWENSINEKEKVLRYLKSNNRYEEYVEYRNKNKNSRISRIKKKYLKKLIDSVEVNDDDNIKRYLKVLLNIFKKENDTLKQYFDFDN